MSNVILPVVTRVGVTKQIVTPAPSPPEPPPSKATHIGLSDYQCNDPMGDVGEPKGYCTEPYFPRNWTPPNMRDTVPEVRAVRYGGGLNLGYKQNNIIYAGVEWSWFFLLQLRNTNIPWEELLNAWRSGTRAKAAFTNRYGSDNCYSDVLGTNPGKQFMRKCYANCPGGNYYWVVEEKTKIIDGDVYLPVYSLDYSKMPRTKAEAEPFAKEINKLNWIVHTGRNVHPEKIGPPEPGAPNGVFKVDDFNYRFPVPLITNSGTQIKGGTNGLPNGIDFRIDYVIAARLKKL